MRKSRIGIWVCTLFILLISGYSHAAYDPCGQAPADRLTASGVYVWKDCTGSQQWNVRTYNTDGLQRSDYSGTITSDQNISRR